MSSAVAELDAGLQAMLLLKPPGVSGSRIQSITALCTQNVQSESVLIQKLYTHFKKAPGTHKLGVVYVVDSVTRKWMEQAKSTGQPISSSAPEGSPAAGVHKVKELLPVLMNDMITSAPSDQKDKIKKLVDIWEKGQTFPLQMLNTFKEKLNAQNQSTTPPGSPPTHLQRTLGLQTSVPAAAPAVAAPNSILEALANMARQQSAPTPQILNPPSDVSYNLSNTQSNLAHHVAAMNPPVALPQVHPPVNVPAPAATFAPQNQPLNTAQYFPSNQANPYGAAPPLAPQTALDPAVAQQLVLIKMLSDQGIPHDKIASLIAAMGVGGVPPPPPQYATENHNAAMQNGANGWNSRSDESRDQNGFHVHDRDAVRSPQGHYRQRSRSRSRSPARGWNARDSPNSRRRDDYDMESPGRNRGGRGRGGRANEYRERSPPRRHSISPPVNGGGSKYVTIDSSIGKGNIKVLSRTLFVGGVTISEYELRQLFSRYGTVQTCIVNKEKRHAFVKMANRADAVAAREGMEMNRAPESQLRTRWGVGFGPRDCSDYQTGISIIPISKLTDADRKWMLTAEYGGSGGRAIEGGMVVEEPDIEIGQGVSSKAISRRMQTDRGGNNGPKSTRDWDRESSPVPKQQQHRRNDSKDDRRGDDRKDRFAITGPPAMPAVPPFGMAGFPSFPMLPNGMPMIPPGFVFPGQPQASTQPPPPGRN